MKAVSRIIMKYRNIFVTVQYRSVYLMQNSCEDVKLAITGLITKGGYRIIMMSKVLRFPGILLAF